MLLQLEAKPNILILLGAGFVKPAQNLAGFTNPAPNLFWFHCFQSLFSKEFQP
jgi:hypothetical protein